MLENFYKWIKDLIYTDNEVEKKETQIFETGLNQMINFSEIKQFSKEYDNYLDSEKFKTEIIKGFNSDDFLKNVYIFLNSKPEKIIYYILNISNLEILIIYSL